MNPLLTDLNDYITRLESELEAIRQALDDGGIESFIDFGGKVPMVLSPTERVEHAIDRMRFAEGPEREAGSDASLDERTAHMVGDGPSKETRDFLLQGLNAYFGSDKESERQNDTLPEKP